MKSHIDGYWLCGMGNGLKKSKIVTKTVVDLKFAKFVTKIMVTKFVVNKIDWPY